MRIHLMENRLARGWAVFGGYWPRGSVQENMFSLMDEQGRHVPVQSEITARWPDGSVKWSRHVARADLLGVGGELLPGKAAPAQGLSVKETESEWLITGQNVRLSVPKSGVYLAVRCQAGEEMAFSVVYPALRIGHVAESAEGCTSQTRSLPWRITRRELETSGPLETVFRFEGVHLEDGTEKMPFRIRMMVHPDGEIQFEDTFLYQGNPERDRLAGWGLCFVTQLAGKSYQRHIRFLTDGQTYHDHPTQLFHWRKRLSPELLAAQQRGETVEASDELDAAAADLPCWEHFFLNQDSADHFCIRKKAWEDGCWLDGMHGRRAPGTLAVSDPRRSLSFHLRECWEKHPVGLEVKSLSSETTECSVWFYSPQAQPFDFRHYDQRSYPLGNYEGFDYSLSDPNGIAVTCRVAVHAVAGYMPDETLKALSETVRRPPVYLSSPEYYHEHRAFGYWSLPDRSTEVGRWIENQMDAAIAFYETEQENRSWYGLFNYGDFMHTYEASRHMWRWDVGGYAWDNTELTPTYWLWLSFLRTGSERVFRLVEALSRHTADVDMYHIGSLKGLGSRHNVRHWGCPCKEPRISMAGHHRPLYYLTGDRRVGDCMEDSLSAAESLRQMRWYRREDSTVRLRSGPDWAALVSDWMTAYERTLDSVWREKIEAGLAELRKTPLGLTSGPEFGFDPETARLYYEGEKENRGMHLQACMGETEVWLETAEALDLPELAEMTARNGRFFFLSPEERNKESDGLLHDRQFGGTIYSAEMQAWAARQEKDDAMARSIWRNLLSLLYVENHPEGFRPVPYGTREDGTPLTEIPWITTNFTSQWCLKTIVTSEFIPEERPKTFAELNEQLRQHPPESHMYGA
ncbi:MAG: hypothetical protein IKO00_06625 [Oscillospiraceae bacterium]|nr:hypothetical protein [Oscillospiraceae bacterium]